MRLWDLLDGKGWWLIVATVCLVLFTALRIGTRRARSTKNIEFSRIWQLPLATLVVWIVLGTLSAIELSSNFSGSAQPLLGHLSIHGGLLWYSSLMVSIGALLVSVLAEILPLWCYQLAPRILVFCAGSTATARWIDPAHRTQQTVAAPAQGTSQQAATPLGQPVSLDPATRRRVKRVGLGLLALLLLVALGFAVLSYLNSQRKPETQVETYLQLLQEGKASEANEMVNPGVDHAQRILLTDQGLAGAQQRLKFESVRTTHVDDIAATVQASYSVNGGITTTELRVERAEKEFGLLNRWQLRTPLLIPVSFQAPTQSIEIAGVQATLAQQDQGFFDGQDAFGAELYAFPGIYDVKGKSTEYVTSSTESMRLLSASDGQARVTITQELSSETHDLVLQAVQKFATSCVTVPTNMAEGCPYELQQTDLASFKVVEQADGLAEISAEDFTAATTKFRYKKNNSEYFDYEPEDLETTFRGRLQWHDGVPEVTEISSSWF